jgi:DNA repair exonuclease SbcCD ATPase subunit
MSSESSLYAHASPSNVRSLQELRRSLIAEFTRAPEPPPQRRASPGKDFIDELGLVADLIENSQQVIGTLSGRLKEYEDVIYELKAKTTDLLAQRESAHQLAAKAEHAVQAEKARADAAEAKADELRDRLSDLESREALVKTYLGRITASLGNLVAAGETKNVVTALAG